MIDVKGRATPSDYFTVGPFEVGSPRLASILESRRANVELCAVTVAWGPKRAMESEHFILHPLEALDCIDRRRSDVVLDKTPKFKGYVSKIRKLVLREDAVAGHHFFRIAKCWIPIRCVSDEVTHEVTEQELTGICLLEPSQYGREFERCRKKRRTTRSQSG